MFDANTVSRQLVYFFLGSMIIYLFSCNESQEQKRIIMKDPKDTKDLEGQLNNPMLFLGTTFIHFLQAQHKTGQYEQMYLFTSHATKTRYSKGELIDFYRDMQFSYSLKLKSFTQEGNQYVLRYMTSIQATVQTIQIQVVVEKDSCRLVLDSINSKLPFVGM